MSVVTNAEIIGGMRSPERRAAGQSLQEYLRSALIAHARQPTLQEIFDEVERNPSASSAPLETTTALVRSSRDEP